MSLISQNYNQNINNNINSSEKANSSNIKEYHPIEFYSLGKIDPNINKRDLFININYLNKGVLNYNHSSHELFDRNLLSVNNSYFDKYKEVKPRINLCFSVKDENNYLDPLLSSNIRKDYNHEAQKQNNINNLEWFHIIKNKVYIVDEQNSKIKKGNNLSTKEFYKEKGNNISEKNNTNGIDCYNQGNSIKNIFNVKRYKQGNEILINKKEHFPKEKEITQIDSDNNYWKKLRIESNNYGNNGNKRINEKKLKENFLYFDKNHKNIIRHKNWWKIDANPSKTKISKGAPKWFNIVPNWKSKLFNDELIRKQDTISVFSKNQNWLTVTPKKKDRRNALEKKRILDMDVTSKLMPRWMEIKTDKSKPIDLFKSIEYNNPIKTKTKRTMAFVDKELNLNRIKTVEYNPSRSVFSYQDFRCNVVTTKDAKNYGEKVSQKPKRFFEWDDGKKFNPKYKKDI